MDKINNILVGTDLSPRADYALVRAATLAGEQQARVSALHVIPGAGGDHTFIEWLRLDPATAAKAEADIKQAAHVEMERQLRALPAQVPVDVHVQIGTPYMKVIQQARSDRADLIVLGAHGERFVRELLFGTTTERVIRNGDRPVLVVKRPPEGPYRKVLVAVDFSDTSCDALRMAQRLAPAAVISVLHVYETRHAHRLRTFMSEDQYEAATKRYVQRLEEEMAAFLRRCDADETKIRRRIRPGYPGTTIARTATRLGADLVAVGTHGLGGLRYVLLGSVAEHVLREARCDVLAVRPQEFQFALP